MNMRPMVVVIFVSINLLFLGMYLVLWSKYWRNTDDLTNTLSSAYDQEIYYYNHGYLPKDNKTFNFTQTKARIKHSIKDNITFVKNLKPRFPNLQPNPDFYHESKTHRCIKSDSAEKCQEKSQDFRQQILTEMQRVLEDEGNILKMGVENPYHVKYNGRRSNYIGKTKEELLCELKKLNVATLRRGDVDGTINNLGDFLPKRLLYENKRFNTCAIVASAGALKNSGLGSKIDSHDLVLRFNNAPTKGFERDVGRKTTLRVLNSQVMSRVEFKFLTSEIYRNVTIIGWDPSNYRASLNDWLKNPEFNLFPNYIEYRRRIDKARIFLINPRAIWELWDFLQSNIITRLRRNPLSSGFLGLRLLLPLCNSVDIFEYIPSTRVTKRCHYFDPEENPACTFGVWHPLAAEKLITYYLNTASNQTVFQEGFARISGFEDINC